LAHSLLLIHCRSASRWEGWPTGHDHLRVPGHPGVLGLHRLRHPHAAQAPHLQRVRGRRHLPLPGRHQPLHGPDVAFFVDFLMDYVITMDFIMDYVVMTDFCEL